ncbi:hypothetical protein [Streptomyces stelliscabiei]|uniref:hypothetical protein n=1 Tax=Streptomyces stelliscabiei TaxID=146820 RepID=UPI0029B3557D|nr:hypothetical protein [Streptomyces stelliscabiei]MDX2554746.1 hypothetical protein [Streptomyces stelliscabiei]MDX2613273.1 hypothetical protein [Streptomyces stelliscabiei]MDX2638451.1 hypothetical protein [Streptomyces stelliscabiei]MDX2661603.1 hypothetical protein [Streptomyces stelliscabiei]MDX2712264.1 hypothetical protein [Streptomyces stelliscabiei]
MSPPLTVVPETAPAADEFAELERRMSLVACGVRDGKTRACDSHQRKGPVLLRIASTGAVDALAMAICGSEHRRSCTACVEKATEIIRIYNERAQ